MASKKYKAKPIEIEALQFNEENYQDMVDFCGDCFAVRITGCELFHISYGWVSLNHGDYVVKIEGGFYRNPKEAFELKYETVE